MLSVRADRVHVPNTQLVIVIQSATCTVCSDALSDLGDHFHLRNANSTAAAPPAARRLEEGPAPPCDGRPLPALSLLSSHRGAAGDRPPPTPGGILTPTQVSHTVTDIDEVIGFHKTVYGIAPSSQYVQGATKFVVRRKSQTCLCVEASNERRGGRSNFFCPRRRWRCSSWKGPGRLATSPRNGSANSCASITCDSHEHKLESDRTVYRRDATNRKYMGSDYNGCWPIWGDNHAALDQQSVDIGTFWANTKKTGFPIWMQTGAMGTKM